MQNKILQYEIAVEEQKALKPKDSQAEQMQKWFLVCWHLRYNRYFKNKPN